MPLSLLLALSLLAQPPAPAPEAPRYRYFPVPVVTPGSTLYAWRDVGGYVPACTDVFAYNELVKSILADDPKGGDDLKAAGRMFTLPEGTAVKILQYDKGVLAKAPAYEVRVMEGKHEGKKGWTVSIWLRGRVALPPEKSKPAPRRKRR